MATVTFNGSFSSFLGKKTFIYALALCHIRFSLHSCMCSFVCVFWKNSNTQQHFHFVCNPSIQNINQTYSTPCAVLSTAHIYSNFSSVPCINSDMEQKKTHLVTHTRDTVLVCWGLIINPHSKFKKEPQL